MWARLGPDGLLHACSGCRPQRPRPAGLVILTQDALDGVVLDELDVGQSDVSCRGLHEGVALVLLLNHHLIGRPEAWNPENISTGTQKCGEAPQLQ